MNIASVQNRVHVYLRVIIFWFKRILCKDNPPLPEISRHLHPVLLLLQGQAVHLGPGGVAGDQVLDGGGQLGPHLQTLTVHLVKLPGVLAAVGEHHRVVLLHEANSCAPDQPE